MSCGAVSLRCLIWRGPVMASIAACDVRSVPKGQPAPDGRTHITGFFAFWAAEWTTAPQPTNSSRAPSYQMCFGVTRSHGPDTAQWYRRIWIDGDCRPTINDAPDAVAPGSKGREGNPNRLALLRPSTAHQEAKGYRTSISEVSMSKWQWFKWDYRGARHEGRTVIGAIWYAVRKMFRPVPF